MVTAAEIVTRIGELDILGTYDDAAWDTPKSRLAQQALRAHTEDAWGAVFADAMACWCLHRLELLVGASSIAAGGLVAGQVAGVRTGDTSIQFLNTTPRGQTNADILNVRTTWGQAYMAYRDGRPDAHLFLTACE